MGEDRFLFGTWIVSKTHSTEDLELSSDDKGAKTNCDDTAVTTVDWQTNQMLPLK